MQQCAEDGDSYMIKNSLLLVVVSIVEIALKQLSYYALGY